MMDRAGMMATGGGSKRRSWLRRLRPRTWRGWLAWTAGVMVGLAALAMELERMTPPWYEPLDPHDETVMSYATRAETLLRSELWNTAQRVPLGEQRWTITQDEINSFLAILDDRRQGAGGPAASATDGAGAQAGAGGDAQTVPGASRPATPVAAVSAPFVVFSTGKVTVSARMRQIPGGNPAGGVGSLVFAVGTVPDVDGKPRAQIRLVGVWAGCLPVPKSVVESRIGAQVPALIAAVQAFIRIQTNLDRAIQLTPQTEEFVRKAAAGEPLPAVIKVDRKQLMIKELRATEGSLTLVLAPPVPAAVMPRPVR